MLAVVAPFAIYIHLRPFAQRKCLKISYVVVVVLIARFNFILPAHWISSVSQSGDCIISM